MSKVRFPFKPNGRRILLIVLTSVLLMTTALSQVATSQPNESDKQKIVRQVAQKWIQVGTEQYNRGFYRAAEQSLLRALDYKDYLTAAEVEKLNKLLEKTHTAAVEKKKVTDHIQGAQELIKKNELIEARAYLESIEGNEFLTEKDQKLIKEKLNEIDNKLKTAAPVKLEPKKEVSKAAVVAASPAVETKALETIEDELLGVSEKLVPVAKQPQQIAVAQPEPIRQERDYIKVINRRRSILQSHTRAVVNDCVQKAQNCISNGEFDKAEKEIEIAQRQVSKNRLQLGDDVYGQYRSELGQLSEVIANGKKQKALQLEEQKRLDAIEAQQRYREQMETDRGKRVTELMENAVVYQKEQRYEEALGQLESLLAIDPLNDQALILKQTLEDIVNFRKQLEIQKESDKQKITNLLNAKEASIPYAEELTYPKNWREIVAKRKPEEAIGYDAVSAAVYKQLEEIVDLSDITPEMPFSEVIEELKNSVDPPLKIFIAWRDLYDNAEIDRTSPVNMDAISSVPLGTALELLLKSVSGGFVDLDYSIDKGVITIGTAEEIGSKLETLVYDATDLLGRPADFYAQSPRDVSTDIETAGGEGLEIEDELDREEMREEAEERAERLMVLIQETVEPDSWYDSGGEGTVSVYQYRKLVVRQTREVHQKVEKLLNDMRKALGHQVAIEARFLVVGENFLEDIGLDLDLTHKDREGMIHTMVEPPEMEEVWANQTPQNIIGWNEDGTPMYAHWFQPVPGSETYVDTYGVIDPTKLGVSQGHNQHIFPEDTKIPGNWRSILAAGEGYGEFPGLELSIGGMVLDTLQANLLIRATQAHRDAKALTAPKVSVLSGESATLRVQRITWYPTDTEFELEEIGDQGDFNWTVDYEEGAIVTGSVLNITPTITPDKKNVLLNIVAELRDFLGWESHTILGPYSSQAGQAAWTVYFPETEISRVETRVSVPDGGTLLLGGQKLTAEIELESGVPVLSKIPILGRLFSNRSKSTDERILLILVRPTIILREEVEAEAIAAME